MKPIKHNPYRILGVLAGTHMSKINKQAHCLETIIAAEQKPPTDDFSFPALGRLTRTVESINNAAAELNLDSDKVNAALFWFWNGNPITDEVAFDKLKEGNVDEAYQIWDKLIVETKEDGQRFWRPVSEKNSSAFHNCFVLEMSRANGNKHTAIVANLCFLDSEFSQKFISTIADSTYKTSTKELQIIFLNEVLQETGKGENLTLSKFISILNSTDFIAKSDFLKNISQKLTSDISAQIEITKNQRASNKANAAKAGDELRKQTKTDLEQLKSIVGVQGFTYSNIADKVANEILQCSIDFFNHSQEIEADNDYHNVATRLAQSADAIAVGNLTKERIKHNINTLEEMKDREILQAIELLKSIKNAYEQACRQIDKKVAALQSGTRPSFGGSQPMKISMLNVSINWSKVEEAKRNALAWDKVVNLVKQVIPSQNIVKIKSVQNQSKISEYQNLVNFLMGKISSWGKREIQYLDYWSPTQQKSTERSSRSSSSTYNSSNTSNQNNWFEVIVGCTIALIIGAIILLMAIFSH